MRSFSRQPVACIGLMPACQRTLVFERVELGSVNRAIRTHVTVGGKAANTAQALRRLGRRCVLAGFNGGATGRFIADYLRQRGIVCAFTATPGPTRTCTTMLDASGPTATELVEDTPRLSAASVVRFRRRARGITRRCGVVALCGTIPEGLSPELWAVVAADARAAGRPLLVDSHGPALLATLPQRPLLVKMNVGELERTLGVGSRSEQDRLKSARRLLATGAQWALITNGPQPAVLVGAALAWRLTPPSVGIRNAIGSGDCVNAGLLDALLRGWELPDAARFGIGCGTANALTDCPADFEPGQALAFAEACRMESVGARRGGRRIVGRTE